MHGRAEVVLEVELQRRQRRREPLGRRQAAGRDVGQADDGGADQQDHVETRGGQQAQGDPRGHVVPGQRVVAAEQPRQADHERRPGGLADTGRSGRPTAGPGGGGPQAAQPLHRGTGHARAGADRGRPGGGPRRQQRRRRLAGEHDDQGQHRDPAQVRHDRVDGPAGAGERPDDVLGELPGRGRRQVPARPAGLREGLGQHRGVRGAGHDDGGSHEGDRGPRLAADGPQQPGAHEDVDELHRARRAEGDPGQQRTAPEQQQRRDEERGRDRVVVPPGQHRPQHQGIGPPEQDDTAARRAAMAGDHQQEQAGDQPADGVRERHPEDGERGRGAAEPRRQRLLPRRERAVDRGHLLPRAFGGPPDRITHQDEGPGRDEVRIAAQAGEAAVGGVDQRVPGRPGRQGDRGEDGRRPPGHPAARARHPAAREVEQARQQGRTAEDQRRGRGRDDEPGRGVGVGVPRRGRGGVPAEGQHDRRRAEDRDHTGDQERARRQQRRAPPGRAEPAPHGRLTGGRGGCDGCGPDRARRRRRPAAARGGGGRRCRRRWPGG